jgi:hypothetical protein
MYTCQRCQIDYEVAHSCADRNLRCPYLFLLDGACHTCAFKGLLLYADNSEGEYSATSGICFSCIKKLFNRELGQPGACLYD